MCLPEYHPRLRWLDKRSISASQLQAYNLSLANNSSSAPADRRKRAVEDGSCPLLDIKLLTIDKVTNTGPSGGSYSEHGSNIKVSCPQGYTLNTARYQTWLSFN